MGDGEVPKPLGSAPLLDHIAGLLAKVKGGIGKRLR
jgi:hypothetical protein